MRLWLYDCRLQSSESSLSRHRRRRADRHVHYAIVNDNYYYDIRLVEKLMGSSKQSSRAHLVTVISITRIGRTTLTMTSTVILLLCPSACAVFINIIIIYYNSVLLYDHYTIMLHDHWPVSISIKIFSSRYILITCNRTRSSYSLSIATPISLCSLTNITKSYFKMSPSYFSTCLLAVLSFFNFII